MHERTQRAIARLLFVFCCAVPTLLTSVCVLVTWTPWYHHRQLSQTAKAISSETGLIVELDDLEFPAPSRLHLFGVRVLDPETRHEIARVRELEWVTRDDGVSMLLHQPEIQSSELPDVWRLVHDRFLCRESHTSRPVRVAANDLTIHSLTGALTLRDVDAWIRPNAEGVEATIQCLPAISRRTAPVSLTVRRQRDGSRPETNCTLDTSGTPLPCSALAEYLPTMARLGSDATFTGSIRWRPGAGLDDPWWVDVVGRFQQVSLDRLFESQVHRLSGMATVQLERCRIEPEKRKSDITGSIHATNGFIGRSLLDSASRHLGFQTRIPDGVSDARGDVPFDQLDLAFDVKDTQLELRGVCRPEMGYHRVVALLGGMPIAHSSDQTLDSLNVIRAVAPSHSVLVPLAAQTRSLLKLFIPPSRPMPEDASVPPRIHTAEAYDGGPTIQQPLR